jgi:hypothetical protein
MRVLERAHVEHVPLAKPADGVGRADDRAFAPTGLIALVGHANIISSILGVTDIPPTEAQAIRSKGDVYREYQKRVSRFAPHRRVRPQRSVRRTRARGRDGHSREQVWRRTLHPARFARGFRTLGRGTAIA